MGKKKNKPQEEVTKVPGEDATRKEQGKRKSTSDDVTDIPSKKIKKGSPQSTDITAGTTLEQVLLVNPSLKPKKKTKRAKQREKHAKNQEAKQEKAKDRDRQEVKEYLRMWSEDKDKWKFQKLKQMYIQTHVFDEDHLDGEMWPTVLEYLSGSKGSGKEALLKRAEAVVKEIDKQAKDSEDDTLLQSSKYQRARELLQNIV
ncbi:uncharacterized protein C7orf50 homolog [Toxorhynchites rutilus septentrionalis]|uniref:uncharacterized protein C7orf50 homolog n=1 Tax=Toxorhynchites rutilus septentrionalis TaxID=329112 RepID=UPI00247ACAB3|nr:uncharacterized protein C7orf50 homolog [Toxorhynchites rutilus septentrionalis]XP_055620406.1 uncharacterized protein C7orf50 homolog [Toxorhynchites rutilus septentrionalis]